MLQPLSETLVEEGPQEPKYGKAYPVQAPVDLQDLNLFANRGQPYDAFATLREEAPVYWHPDEQFGGFWVVTRYEDIKKVSLTPQTFSSGKGGILINYGSKEMRDQRLFRANVDNMIAMDNPQHMELRTQHMPYFKPSFVNELHEKVQVKAGQLLDNIAPMGECDLVENVSAELPLFTLSEMLGIPEGDRPKFIRWMRYLEMAQNIATKIENGKEATEEDFKFFGEFLDMNKEMFEYGYDMLLRRRKEPTDDLLSAIANATVDGELLPDEYLDGSWILIVFAGNDTTRNSLSGTMKLLTENPEQKEKVLADFDLLPNMVEEAIRMVTPVIHMRRTATEDTEIRGQKIAEGEKVVMWYGSANRDPEVFESPDSFDVTRANAGKHLAFGIGTHVCIGNRIAKMQLKEVYRQILTRFPDMEYAGGMEIAPNNFVNAISKLPVKFKPQKRSAA